METNLSINLRKCTRCRKCVRVCPVEIFNQPDPEEGIEERIEVRHPQLCIGCGHCVSACRDGAVLHPAFPPDRIHSINRAKLPAPEQTMLLLQSRRSNRAFTNKPIPTEELDQILEAAHLAPTASNLQQVEFTLVTDPAMLQKIITLSVGIFANMARKMDRSLLKPVMKSFLPEMYRYLPRLRKMQEEFESGKDPILRKATALLLIHTPADSRTGCQDANLAYQNGSLMAESLGISQFYTGFLGIALGLDKKREICRLLGIEGTIHAGMALAIPEFIFPNYADRKEIRVRRF